MRLRNCSKNPQTLGVRQSAIHWRQAVLAGSGARTACASGSKAGRHHQENRLALFQEDAGDSIAVLWRIGEDHARTDATFVARDDVGHLRQ